MERLNQMFSPFNNFSFQTMTEEFDIDNFYNKLETMIQNLKVFGIFIKKFKILNTRKEKIEYLKGKMKWN